MALEAQQDHGGYKNESSVASNLVAKDCRTGDRGVDRLGMVIVARRLQFH